MAFVSLKAFGDLVITRTSLARFGPTSIYPPIVIGHHLVALDNVLTPSGKRIVLEHGEPGIPALFDVRKSGLWRAIASGTRLRRTLGELSLPVDVKLVFDRLGYREKYIAGSHSILSLSGRNPNIYLDYEQLLKPNDRIHHNAEAIAAQIRTVGIFPGSRIFAKQLTEPLVATLLRRVEALGFHPILFLLDGEQRDLEVSGLPYRHIARNFGAMINAVSSVDAVISADSLPAHLAEYLERPVFVVSPVQNQYWLPHTSFLLQRWVLFDELEASDRLAAFLSPDPQSPPGPLR